jgi:8-oxo-dGTP diphosphatase
MTLQVGVKILLENDEGKYLLLKRSAEKYPDAGPQWEIPGGRIDPGSSLSENLRREIKEETGLEMTSEPKLIAAQDIISLKKDKHIVRLTYTGTAHGEVVLSDEHTEYKWLKLAEILTLEPVDMYLKEVLDKKVI